MVISYDGVVILRVPSGLRSIDEQQETAVLTPGFKTPSAETSNY